MDFAIIIYDECLECKMPMNPYHEKNSSCKNSSCVKCDKSMPEKVDANGNTTSDYEKADKECPKGYIVVWNRWEKGFKYRKLDKYGYMEEEE